ncbi:MAG: Fe-S cluster assembly sulfur transfer protein SufU [Bacteroidota bacterium]
MTERLKKLYQEVIVRRSREPYHYRKDAPGEVVEAYNPLCGDQYQLYVEEENQQLEGLHFYGHGCAISKASSSVLVESLEGLSREEAKEKVALFLKLLQSDEELEGLPESFEAFIAARQFPARLKCASLSWEAMRDYLEE